MTTHDTAYSARMTTHDTPNPILEAARKLQEQRLLAVQRLVDTRARIDTAQAQLVDAQREDSNAYQKALKEGWSEAELRQVGITPPARKAPGRPRGRARGGNALADVQLQREAAASVSLDRDQTHVVGGSGEPGDLDGAGA